MEKNEQYSKLDWMSDIIRHVINNYNNRKVVLWGKYVISDRIKNILEQYNIKVSFYVDSEKTKQNEKDILAPDYLNGKSKEIYVVVPLAYYDSLKSKLVEYGYRKNEDYYYFCDCIIKQSDDFYEDSHGNKIIGNHKGLKVVFSGFNSLLEIQGGGGFLETSIYIHSDSKIKMGSNTKCIETKISIDSHSEIEIAHDCTLTKTILSVLKNCNMKMGYKCNFMIRSLTLRDNSFFSAEGENIISCKEYIDIDKYAAFRIGYNSDILDLIRISMGKYSSVYIGDKTLIRERSTFLVSNFTKIKIGDKCLFSDDVVLCSNDSHSIFDVDTKKNINSTEEICKKRGIDIGDHVWIGIRSTILYNTKIGNGSIVGAGSLVKSTFPNNCIVAGTPAKIVRRNVAWSNKDCSMDISDCGEKYIHLTEEWIAE